MAADMGLTKLDEILAKLTALQENQARWIHKQNNTILILNNSVNACTSGLQSLGESVVQGNRSTQQIPSELPANLPIQLQLLPQVPNSRLVSLKSFESRRPEAQRFSGDNPSVWISQMHRYFEYYDTPDHRRLIISSFYLDGNTLDWYEGLDDKQLFLSWNEFCLAIETRFSQREIAEVFERSSNWLEDVSLESHQVFDQLSDKIKGIPKPVLVSCVVPYVRLELRVEPHLYRQQSLVQPMGLDTFVDVESMVNKCITKKQEDELDLETSFWNSKVPTRPPMAPTPAADNTAKSTQTKFPVNAAISYDFSFYVRVQLPMVRMSREGFRFVITWMKNLSHRACISDFSGSFTSTIWNRKKKSGPATLLIAMGSTNIFEEQFSGNHPLSPLPPFLPITCGTISEFICQNQVIVYCFTGANQPMFNFLPHLSFGK